MAGYGEDGADGAVGARNIFPRLLQKAKEEKSTVLLTLKNGDPIGGIMMDYDDEAIEIKLQAEGIAGTTYYLGIKRDDVIVVNVCCEEWREVCSEA